jgi:REP element-mobilizing transposase RayT
VPGLKRLYGSGDLHFITASYYRRQPLLGTAGRRDLFLKVFEQARRRYQFVVLGYAVMPEHFHLLISEQGKVQSFGGDSGAEARVGATALPAQEEIRWRNVV